MSGRCLRAGTGPSSGPQSVVACDDHGYACPVSHTTANARLPVFFFPKPGVCLVFMKIHLEKSTLYKHSGPLDLGILGTEQCIPAVLTGLGLISPSFAQLDRLSRGML